MSCRLVSIVVVLALALSGAVVKAPVAQPINPYLRLVDPRAIAVIDNPDSGPVTGRAFMMWTPDYDPIDSMNIWAQATGAGLITHIWSNCYTTDSLTKFKLWIDGALYRTCTYRQMFLSPDRCMRNPFDTMTSQGYTCDVQIPYHHSFKLTYSTKDYRTWFGINWRPFADSTLVPTLDGITLNSQQAEAESAFRRHGSPWDSSKYVDVSGDHHSSFAKFLAPGDTATCFTLEGSAMIHALRMSLPGFHDSLPDLRLLAYWDDARDPAIDAPLRDFFACPDHFYNVWAHSFETHSDSSTIACYFPMPFSRSARIVLINSSKDSVQLSGEVQYSIEPINRDHYGYFHAHFSESNPTLWGVWHPVMHVHGKGSCVGLMLAIPHCPAPCALEGDATFLADSSQSGFFRTTGTEDYFNAGQYFGDGPFSLPFAGGNHLWTSFYRLHYMDRFQFDSTFDFNFQHGGDNDVPDVYRTVAFYYLRHIPFWSDRDTISPGDSWTIGGGGYAPNEAITASFAGATLFTTVCDARGRFSVTHAVPASITPGRYALVVNGLTRPQTTLVIAKAVADLDDPHDAVGAKTGDTVYVRGVGFVAGERVLIWIANHEVTLTAVVDAKGYLSGSFRVPLMNDGDYEVLVVGSKSGSSTTMRQLHTTRKLLLEFEDLYVDHTQQFGSSRPYCTSDTYRWDWSKQGVAQFVPDSTNAYIQFAFYVPHGEPYHVGILYSKGSAFGTYDMSIDGNPAGTLFGKFTPAGLDPSGADTLPLGDWELTEGWHQIRFEFADKKDSRSDGIWLDRLDLVPVAPHVVSVDSPVDQAGTPLIAVPNPVKRGESFSVQLPVSIGEYLTVDAVVFAMDGAEVDNLASVPIIAKRFVEIPTKGLASGSYVVRLRAGTLEWNVKVVVE